MATRASKARHTLDEDEEPVMSGALEPSSSSTTVQEESEERPSKKRKVKNDRETGNDDVGSQVPRVGVAVFAIRAVEEDEAGSFIVGKRKGSAGAGTWALPGGHLEFGESFEDGASRELAEETGIDLPPEQFRYLTAINSVWEENGKTLHYITIVMGCGLFDDEEPEVMEPEKCEGWEFIYWDELQKLAKGEYINDTFMDELFVPLQNLAIKSIEEEGFDAFDPHEVWKREEDKAAGLRDGA